MSVVGSVSVRVVPSFSGMHQQIGRQFAGAGASAGSIFAASMGKTVMTSTARNVVFSRAGEQAAERMAGSMSRTILGTDFGRTFTNAFGQGRAVAAGEGGEAAHSWTNRVSSVIGRDSTEVQTAITRPFTGVLGEVASVGNATGLSFVNAEASSIGSRSEYVGAAALQPFSGVMEGVGRAGSATGLQFTDTVSMSLASRQQVVGQAAVQPFSGVMSEVTSVGNATGLNFANAASSSIALGGATAGEGFMSRLAQTIGSHGGAAVGAAGAVAQSIGDAFQGVGGTISNVSQQLSTLSGSLSSVGGSLTAGITLPAAGAAAAVGGITAAFGWGRLTSLDTAKGQLRGLGYEAADVDRITGQLVDDLEGGMMTMGDATSAAAGAMAAGVKEGAELTKYIQMLDAAVVGGTGTFYEMNNIFARTADLGYLNANNFDMLRQRMPGFSSAMQEHVGVSDDAFREMLNNGEISLEEFLEVMDDFGGDMALEYAKTWAGMVQNTKNYIGIIGEALLEGVFQRSKEEIGEFIHFLSSDDMAAWAEEFGGKINEVFGQVVDTVRGAIDWWNDLDDSQQNLMLSLGGVAVAAGPVLLVFGKIAGALSAVGRVLGPIVSRIGGLIASLGGAATQGSLLSGIIGGLSRVLGFLMGPIGWVIGGFIAVWQASESFREAVINLGVALWDSLVDAFEMVWGHVQDLWASLQDLWVSLTEGGGIVDLFGIALSWLIDLFAWLLPIVIEFAGYLISVLVVALDWVVQAITSLVEWLTGLGDESTTQGAIWAAVWEWMSNAVSWAWENVIKPTWDALVWAWDALSTGIAWAWENIIKPAWDALSSAAVWMWENVIQPVWSAMVWAWDALSAGIAWAWENIIKPAWNALLVFAEWMWENVIQPVWSAISWAWDKLSAGIAWAWENVIKPAWDALVFVLTWLWENVVSPIFRWIGEHWETMAGVIRSVWNGFLRPVFNLLIDIITWLWKNVAEPYFENIWEAFKTAGQWIWDTWTDYIWPALKRFGDRAMDLWEDYIEPALGWIADEWEDLRDTLVDVWENHVQPMLQDFGDFFHDEVVPRVEKAVDLIKAAWSVVEKAFGTPIHFVLDTIWNNGVVSAFNYVADLIPGADPMPEVDVSEIPQFAKGGLHKGGWALVGEEGPELVNFSNPGRVYTADDTSDMLGGTDAPMTAEELAASQGHHSQYGIGNWFTDGLGRIADATGISDAIDWARGQLADGFRSAMEPVTDTVSSAMSGRGAIGTLGSGMVDWMVDSIADWIDAEDSVPDVYDGEFTANPGGFNRPAGGPITSMAGPRSYIGRFGNMHYGVDIGVPIGSAIRAAWDGVIKSRSGGGMDQTVVVNHGGFDTAYMHNSAITRAVGSQVSGGDIIARSGTAGSGPHLHFELHPGGYYNPTLAVNDLFRDKGGLIYPGMNMVRNDTGRAEYVFNQQQFENLNRLAEQGGNGGRNLTVNQYGMDYRHADRNAQAFVFAERRESRKAGSR